MWCYCDVDIWLRICARDGVPSMVSTHSVHRSFPFYPHSNVPVLCTTLPPGCAAIFTTITCSTLSYRPSICHSSKPQRELLAVRETQRQVPDWQTKHKSDHNTEPFACMVSSSCSVFDPGAEHMSRIRWSGCGSSSSTGTMETAS